MERWSDGEIGIVLLKGVNLVGLLSSGFFGGFVIPIVNCL